MKALKQDLKGRVAKGLNYGIEAIDDILSHLSLTYNQFITLRSKYSDLMHYSSINTLSYEQLELGFDKIRSQLLRLIDTLSEEDINKQTIQTEMTNNALPYRRSNFFQLLEVHYKNLEKIGFTVNEDYNQNTQEWIKRRTTGREAIFHIYDNLSYSFKRAAEQSEATLKQHFQKYFSSEYGAFEVYLKNVNQLLSYILEQQEEQLFFLNTLKSSLSKYELAMIYYYGLTDIDPAFSKMATQAKLFTNSALQTVLITVDDNR